jgi:sarcosine oxidase subunit delta
MSFQIECPNCGLRPVWEFHFGGAVRRRPEPTAGDREWAAYLYSRANVCGEQTESWYHRSGCKLWFVAERDTRNNQVLATRRSDSPEAAGG